MSASGRPQLLVARHGPHLGPYTGRCVSAVCMFWCVRCVYVLVCKVCVCSGV